MSKDNKYIQQLLSEARSGSRASLGRLAVVVRERLYPFVLRTTLNHDLTEDVLQETLMTLVRKVDSLRDGRKFWPWVFRVAWSRTQDNLRRRRLRYFKKAELFRNQCRADNNSPLEAKIHEEQLRQVSDMVEQLSRQHRDVLRLRYYEQLPYAKIASLTRTTPQEARVRSHRARKSLKARLPACCL
jgi:RNA polymerase sigma-70 factor (ECF subfamily)